MTKKRSSNNSREIRDIRFPTSHVPEGPAAEEVPARKINKVPTPPRAPIMSSSRPRRRRGVKILAGVLLVSLATAGVFWYQGRMEDADRLRDILAQILHVENVEGAPRFLPPGISESPDSIGEWMSLLKGIFADYGGFKDASWQALASLNKIGASVEDIPVLFLRKDGPGLVSAFEGLHAGLASLGDVLKDIGDTGNKVPGMPDLSGYLAFAPDVERARVATQRSLELLRSPGEHHVLILFGNSAELRPGGGFLGSFADISFGDSKINDITIHDINEVDRGLEANIVPPKPMQGLVGRWRSADANWFFDYPKSAGKTLDIMSRSSFYGSSTLDGAILISPQVIQDILRATGPLVLPDGGMTVTAETIVPMIQREVQDGQASGDENPKEILSMLLPLVEEKLQKLDSGSQAELFKAAREWVRNRDLVVYMRDQELAGIISYYGANGSVYALPGDFSGDYLAAVNANIGGGKSDAFITDVIDVQSDLRADGLVHNHVTVVRENSARQSEEWWYRVTNQNYLQVFTPPGAELIAASGGEARGVRPRADFTSGFEADPDLVEMEATLGQVPGIPAVSRLQAFGKNVFATWVSTPAGGTGIVKIEYRRMLKSPFRDGDTYDFVLERQSGAKQSLYITLNAPPGFVWEENGFSTYEYVNEDTPGRLTLRLTLSKI